MTKLVKSTDFNTVFRQGRSATNRGLVLYWLTKPADPPRVGFCVGRKIGHAVQRNRIKRLLRESWRRLSAKVTTPADLVFVARAAGVQFSLDDWVAAMDDLLRGTGLVIGE